MKAYVTEITPSPSGEEVTVKAELIEDRSVMRIKGEISTDLFKETELPWQTSENIEIDEEKYELLSSLMKKTDAIKLGIGLLSYAPNTKRALKEKLVQRGVLRDIAEEAVDILEEYGYINEFSLAENFVIDLAERRLYGRARIKNELFAKGFSSNAASHAIETIDTDFSAICAKRIEKTLGLRVFDDRQSRVKAVSSLMRYGFTTDEIKNAIIMLKEKG